MLHLDLDSGRLLGEAPIQAWPGGIHPVHHPNGWAGLSYGEGQHTFRACWARSHRQPGGQVRIETLAAGWAGEIHDADRTIEGRCLGVAPSRTIGTMSPVTKAIKL